MPHRLTDFRFFKNETVGVVDLGSNALRASVYRKIGKNLHLLYSVRDPIRLGEDVFKNGMVSRQKLIHLEESFIKLLYLFTEYGVTEVKACTTSAMREAKNSQAIIKHLEKITGIKLEIITGEKEAQYVLDAVAKVMNLKKKNVVVIDLGGGSTEVSVINKKGEIHVKSFPVGTVRLLNQKNIQLLEQQIRRDTLQMSLFVKKHLNFKKIDLVVGTGGNLRRFGKIRKKTMNKNEGECLTSEIERMAQSLNSMTYIDRVRKLEMDSHRADVILPASLLISKFLKSIQSKKVILPQVGLKEGIALDIFQDKKLKFIFKK